MIDFTKCLQCQSAYTDETMDTAYCVSCHAEREAKKAGGHEECPDCMELVFDRPAHAVEHLRDLGMEVSAVVSELLTIVCDEFDEQRQTLDKLRAENADARAALVGTLSGGGKVDIYEILAIERAVTRESAAKVCDARSRSAEAEAQRMMQDEDDYDKVDLQKHRSYEARDCATEIRALPVTGRRP